MTTFVHSLLSVAAKVRPARRLTYQCLYDRYNWDLFLLSVDEGISGYRDDSLETVKRNEQQVSLCPTPRSHNTRRFCCLTADMPHLFDALLLCMLQYQIPLTVVSYQELYGWTMDEIVREVGTKNNCTFCGVFRRQALDRGATLKVAEKIATGHNADDIAETVILNMLRGDLPRCCLRPSTSDGVKACA